MENSRRAEMIAAIERLIEAREKTTSRYLKRDYTKAIKRKQKQLSIYDRFQQEARNGRT